MRATDRPTSTTPASTARLTVPARPRTTSRPAHQAPAHHRTVLQWVAPPTWTALPGQVCSSRSPAALHTHMAAT